MQASKQLNLARCSNLIRHVYTNLFQESGGERLDAELERSEVGRLVQALHFLGHKRLVNLIALSVLRIHWVEQRISLELESKPWSQSNSRFEHIWLRYSLKTRSTSARYSAGMSDPGEEYEDPSEAGYTKSPGNIIQRWQHQRLKENAYQMRRTPSGMPHTHIFIRLGTGIVIIIIAWTVPRRRRALG